MAKHLDFSHSRFSIKPLLWKTCFTDKWDLQKRKRTSSPKLHRWTSFIAWTAVSDEKHQGTARLEIMIRPWWLGRTLTSTWGNDWLIEKRSWSAKNSNTAWFFSFARTWFCCHVWLAARRCSLLSPNYIQPTTAILGTCCNLQLGQATGIQ